ncbi:MAG: tripartite tricarboxylate transporter substrate binding protein [Comamonadaceae bacterium]|nr:tripartite tricarboxylate transporter substrate binding protein [Comamonadaceae bacterium]
MKFVISILAALPIVFSAVTHAQSYPNKPIRVVVPYAPAGNVDIVARIINIKLEAELGQSVVTENLAGGAGVIGTQTAQRSAPDGYRLLASSSAHVITPNFQKAVPYDPVKDFVPISQITAMPMVMMISSELPAKNYAEFLKWAKSLKEPMNYGGQRGTAGNFSGEMWSEATGIPVVQIPYKAGTGAAMDLAGGRVPMTFDAVAAAASHVKSGKIRVVAITGPVRSPMLPDVPTFAELGVSNMDIQTWHGYWAPKGTPQDVIDKLGAAMVKISQMPEVREQIQAVGATVVGSTPKAFAAFTQAESERWAARTKQFNIQAN